MPNVDVSLEVQDYQNIIALINRASIKGAESQGVAILIGKLSYLRDQALAQPAQTEPAPTNEPSTEEEPAG